jgi:hypothetical protein
MTITNSPPSKLWWVYFALYLLLLGYGVFTLALGVRMGAGFNIISISATIIDVSCLVGLFFYIQQRSLFSSSFWQFLFFVFTAKALIATALFLRTFFMFRWDGSVEAWVSVVGLLSLILALPMIYAIWRYAFRSKALWNRLPQT